MSCMDVVCVQVSAKDQSTGIFCEIWMRKTHNKPNKGAGQPPERVWLVPHLQFERKTCRGDVKGNDGLEATTNAGILHHCL